MTSQLNCRICGSKTVFIGSLGEISISSFTVEPQDSLKFPLALMYCENCTLLQLGRETPRDLLYENYWYRSALNPVIVKDLQEIAKWGRGLHIDIGSNDGTLLKYSEASRKIAIDPSNIDSGYERYHRYWEDVDLGEKADLITAIACLYDLPDPVKFMWNVKRHLKPDGIFITQLMTLGPMIENNDVGNICHEHLEYYSYRSLVVLCAQTGLEIFKVETNSINGGSYRLYIRHRDQGSVNFSEKEYSVGNLKDFFKRIEKNRQDFWDWIADWKSGGRNMAGYGASTKMGTIMQYYGVVPRFVVDVNPDKIGKFTVMGAEVVDTIPEGTEYLWCFPYGFIDYFKAREKGYTGKWLTTIPNFQIQ